MTNSPEMNHFQNECQPIQEEIQPLDKEAPSSKPQDFRAQRAAGAKKCFFFSADNRIDQLRKIVWQLSSTPILMFRNQMVGRRKRPNFLKYSIFDKIFFNGYTFVTTAEPARKATLHRQAMWTTDLLHGSSTQT